MEMFIAMSRNRLKLYLLCIFVVVTDCFVPQPCIFSSKPVNNVNELDRAEECRSESFPLYGKKNKSIEKEQKLQRKILKEKEDALASSLLDLCTQSNRDVDKIRKTVNELSDCSINPAQSASLTGCWRLVFVTDAEIIGCIGTGLHKLPLTRMEDTFVTFSISLDTKREIELIEVLRIMGPFPNIKNTLNGQYKPVGSNKLFINYSQMIDGTGNTVTSGNPAMDGSVTVNVLYVGDKVLVMSPDESDKTIELMVFEKENDLVGTLKKLRLVK